MSLKIGSGSGTPGTPGANGADGKSIRYGSGAPSNGLGVDGDFYIDTVAHNIYGPKASGSWPAGTSIIGPQGPQGNAGSQGSQGPAGNNGVTITVSTTAPSSPSVGDLWVDTN